MTADRWYHLGYFLILGAVIAFVFREAFRMRRARKDLESREMAQSIRDATKGDHDGR
jgi:hypothetical protein